MESFILAAVCGVAVGILSGLLGIGGGTLMVPLFRLGFGLPAIGATATSLFTIIPTSLSGCITHIKNKTCIPKLGIATGLAGACTSALGVFCASSSPAWLIMLAAALIILYSAFTMVKKAIRMPKGKSPALGAKSTALPVDDRPQLNAKQLLKGSMIGLIAGFASGYVGVGGGFIMVPLFVSLLGITMKHASGTSLIAVTILAIPGVIEQGFLGNIDYLAGIAMAIGTIPGALIGASLVRRIPERQLRFVFAVFLLISAVVLAVNEFLPFFVG